MKIILIFNTEGIIITSNVYISIRPIHSMPCVSLCVFLNLYFPLCGI